MKKEKNVRILSAIRFICILQETKEWEIWSVIGYLLLSLHDELSYDNQYLQRSLRRTFERQIIQDFNIYDNAVEMKKSVFEATESFFEEDVTVDDVDIGYMGKSNNKRLIKTDQHVDDAYTSRFHHKHSELVIFIEEKKRTRQGQKRKLSTTRNGRWIIFIYFNCCYLMSLLLLS